MKLETGYTSKVVGTGVRAQRLNPEVKVRGVNPVLQEAKNRLELFNMEVQEVMPGLGHRDLWDETGSGESSGECDDEDGCEGSGESVATPRFTEAEKTSKAVKVYNPPITSTDSSCSAHPPLFTFIIFITLALGLQWTFI